MSFPKKYPFWVVRMELCINLGFLSFMFRVWKYFNSRYSSIGCFGWLRDRIDWYHWISILVVVLGILLGKGQKAIYGRFLDVLLSCNSRYSVMEISYVRIFGNGNVLIKNVRTGNVSVVECFGIRYTLIKIFRFGNVSN